MKRNAKRHWITARFGVAWLLLGAVLPAAYWVLAPVYQAPALAKIADFHMELCPGILLGLGAPTATGTIKVLLSGLILVANALVYLVLGLAVKGGIGLFALCWALVRDPDA
jgi:hypothetical protein